MLILLRLFFTDAIGYALSVASELSACAVIISYWSDLNAAIWIAVLCLPFLVLNMLGVKYYGESEVITASLKVITLVGYVRENCVYRSTLDD